MSLDRLSLSTVPIDEMERRCENARLGFSAQTLGVFVVALGLPLVAVGQSIQRLGRMGDTHN